MRSKTNGKTSPYGRRFLYLVGVNPKDNSIHESKPCPICARSIIQAGIRNVYLRVGEGAGNYVEIPAEQLRWVREPFAME